MFNLELIELPEEAQVIIYNTLGQIVFSENVPNTVNEINAPELETGAYIVKVVSGKFAEQIRMIVRK